MNEVLVVVAVVAAMVVVMAAWVWVLGRIEARQQRRDAELTGGPDEQRPRHMRDHCRRGRWTG